MSTETSGAVTERRVPKPLLWWSWLYFMFIHMTSQSFDRGYSNAFTAAMIPILRYLYRGRPDADEQIRDGLLRTRAYYLCEQSFSGVAFAIIVGMEEKKANGMPINGDMIVATRTSIMGPMSGLGDTLHGSTSRQLAVALTIPFCLAGYWVGALAMLILVNIGPLLTPLLGVPRGYARGASFVLELVKGGVLQRYAVAAGVAIMFVMGGTAADYLQIELDAPPVQAFLDALLPGVVPIAAIFVFYALVSKKISRNKLMIGTLVLAVPLALLHVLS